MSFLRFALFALIVGFATNAHARVFSFQDRRIAPFFRGTVGYSQLQDSAFADSSGAGTSIDGTVPWNYGGELGLALGLTEQIFLRFGAEIIRGSNGEVSGASSTGTPYFTLDSSVFVFNPNVAVEYVYQQSGNTRFFGSVSFGMANVTVENRYDLTTAGSTAFSKSDYTEKAETNTYSAALAMGLETLFTDNVTFTADVGYRYLPVKDLKLKHDVASIAQPTGQKGDTLKNGDGTDRELDMGGFYLGIGFRFYLNFM